MGRHTVRVRTDRGWEVLGTDRFPGVEPSPPQVQSDPAGFAGASFALPRPDPGLPQPDLAHSVECEIDFGGVRVFEGRIAEAPVSGLERRVNVQGRGWQYALDENPLVASWCMSTLGDWQDGRSFVGAKVLGMAADATGAGSLAGAGNVVAGEGQILIGWIAGVPWPVNGAVGVTCDFGPDPARWPLHVGFKATRYGSPGGVRLYCRNHDIAGDISAPVAPAAMNDGLALQPFVADLTGPSTTGVYTATFPAACRFVTIFLRNDVATYTPTLDDSMALTEIAAFPQERYARSHESAVRVSTALAEAFALTPGLATPTVETEEFVDEMSSQAPGFWMRGQGADELGVYTPTVYSAPTFGQSPGPLAGEPSLYASFDGVDDGMSVLLGTSAGQALFDRLDDFTLFIVFRTSQAAPAGTAWPNGRGLFDAATATAGDGDYGLQIVAGGKVSGGVGGGGGDVSTPNVVVNDGRWHTALLRRKRRIPASITGSDLEVIVDGVSGGIVQHDVGGGGSLFVLALYIARNAAGNYAAVDVAEAAFIPANLGSDDVGFLHRSALAKTAGTVKRTLLRLPECSIPVGAPKTTRGLGDDLNMYHRYRLKIGRDRLPTFYPQPTTPRFALTDNAVERFVDTSTSAAQDSYNRALILGTRPTGRAVGEYRHAADLPGARLERVTSPAFGNPAAEADASGWTIETGMGGLAVTRVTAGQRSGAGGFRIDADAAGQYLRTRQAITGAFVKGVTYVIGLYYRVNVGVLGSNDFVSVYDTARGVDIARVDWEDMAGLVTPFYRHVPVAFVAPYDTSALALRVQIAGADFYFDDLYVARSQYHRLDRLGQVRTRTMEFGQNIDVPTARALADAFLQSKLRTPFAGSLPIGPGDLVTYGPAPMAVPPAVLCDNVGELVHFPGLIDPDTGGQGRDGQIVGLSFDCATEQADVSFDNTRDNFEALMARGALFRGGAS